MQQIVGHARDGVTLQVYHGGDTEQRLRDAVESVVLPTGAQQEPARPPKAAKALGGRGSAQKGSQ